MKFSKKNFFLFFAFLVFFPFLVSAQFPLDAKTLYRGYTGNQTQSEVLPVGTYRILGVSIATDATAFSLLYYCGNDVFYATKNPITGQILISYLCENKNISITTTGGLKDYYTNLVYTDYDLARIGRTELISTTTASSTFYIDKSWTYGELFISFLFVFLIFLIIFLLVFSFFFEPVLKIRGKK